MTARLGLAGVVVGQTIPGLPAEQAGVRGVDRGSGNGRRCRRRGQRQAGAKLADLTDELERVGVGKRVTLVLRRGGRDVSVEVAVADVGQR